MPWRNILSNLKIYHITHVDNLPRILQSGMLWSDANMITTGLFSSSIGMSSIKQNRLGKPVACHPDLMVGQCVPFYFCPRSLMLFIMHKGNHPEVSYRGGQSPIIHLQMDANAVATWAYNSGLRWAFTDRNAWDSVATFYDNFENLIHVNWGSVHATDFRQCQDEKQAEFLVQNAVSASLIEKIGVIDNDKYNQVAGILGQYGYTPELVIERDWYF